MVELLVLTGAGSFLAPKNTSQPPCPFSSPLAEDRPTLDLILFLLLLSSGIQLTPNPQLFRQASEGFTLQTPQEPGGTTPWKGETG